MLDLARAAAGDKFTSLLQKSFFSLAATSVIITYLVAFSATNMHIYHKVAIWHLMQAWARFALQCLSLYEAMQDESTELCFIFRSTHSVL